MENNITREQFLADVKHEIDSLKNLGTPDELAKLNFTTFSSKTPNGCIYGQMTGSCESFRAKELMDASCVRVTKASDDFSGVIVSTNTIFENIAQHINGEYQGQTWIFDEDNEIIDRRYGFLSMLELYITLDGANNRNIISYLKSETEELNLDTIK